MRYPSLIRAIVAAIQEIDDGKRTSFRYVHRGEDKGDAEGAGGREFHVRIALMELGGSTFATVTRYDVTELAELRKLREDFDNGPDQDPG